MATGLEPSTQAGEAYDALASGYDTLTRDYAYDRWLPALEQLAHDHGLAGHRVLDVACGTGESFLPLRARGYEVTGCDISAEMLGRARRKAPDVLLHHLDCSLDRIPLFVVRRESMELFRIEIHRDSQSVSVIR